MFQVRSADVTIRASLDISKEALIATSAPSNQSELIQLVVTECASFLPSHSALTTNLLSVFCQLTVRYQIVNINIFTLQHL